MTHDVVVVGAGPAGLSGAVALGRALRTVLVIDGDEPRNAAAPGLHNFLTRDGVTPHEFGAAARADAERYGVTFRTGTVREVTGTPDHFRVALADGDVVEGRRLLVATGLRDVLPDIPGVAERWGRTVLHCPTCHGYEARGSVIGILGDPMTAVNRALVWRQWTDDLALFLNDATMLDDRQRQQLGARGIAVIPGRVVAVDDDSVRLADGAEIPNKYLVVHTRVETRADFLTPLGLKPVELPMDLGSQLPVEDPTGRTSVPGVWVAGNATDLMAQAVTAAAAGLTAGEAVNWDLVMADSA